MTANTQKKAGNKPAEIQAWSTTTSSTPEFTWTVAPNKREQLHKDVPLALVCGLGCSY